MPTMTERTERVALDKTRVAYTARQAKAVQALVAAQAAVDDIDKMRARAEKMRNKALGRADAAGLSHPELGKLVGYTKGRVWQLVQAGKPTPAEAGEADEDQAEQLGADDA